MAARTPGAISSWANELRSRTWSLVRISCGVFSGATAIPKWEPCETISWRVLSAKKSSMTGRILPQFMKRPKSCSNAGSDSSSGSPIQVNSARHCLAEAMNIRTWPSAHGTIGYIMRTSGRPGAALYSGWPMVAVPAIPNPGSRSWTTRSNSEQSR